MFIIRQATVDDVPTLLKLAKMVHFINLPADPDIIRTKVIKSRRSFSGQTEDPTQREFMFVLEHVETGNVVGTSSVISAISWAGHPHVYLRVRRREHYSEDLQTGQVHVTLQLCTDEDGPSEIGGLILGPSYRGHKEKLGALLSLVRFHYMGLHRQWFSDRIIAEMMGALTPDSSTMLWEYLGRRFINLDYTEADRFSQQSKEFIISLFPEHEIYASMMPPEARALIGKVGPETEPARRMLERLGFKYTGNVDPFDGGPYLEAHVPSIWLVADTRALKLGAPDGTLDSPAFISFEGTTGFRAVRADVRIAGDTVHVPTDAATAIGATLGDTIGCTPLPRASDRDAPRTTEAATR